MSLKMVKPWNQMFRMSLNDASDARSLDDLSRDLARLARDGSPAIARLAQWVLDRPQELAFHSVRGLAELSQANVNTVYRLSLALGYSGYDECRRGFQAALRRVEGLYGSRAARLSVRGEAALADDLCEAAKANLSAVFTEANAREVRAAAERLLAARRIHCIGVRSCFSLAHYFSYLGRMAFPNFERPAVEPGGIADILADAGPEDVVILISFSPYSAEVVRAHGAALSQGAGLIAITDSYGAQIAAQADLVFRVPMAGPQPLPSHGAGFALVEWIISEMTGADAQAPARIAGFERRMIELGSYVPTED